MYVCSGQQKRKNSAAWRSIDLLDGGSLFAAVRRATRRAVTVAGATVGARKAARRTASALIKNPAILTYPDQIMS